MDEGVRIELEISGDHCPVLAVSDDQDASVDSINRAETSREDGTVTEEVVFDEQVSNNGVPFEQVIEHNQFSVYQFERDHGCACDQLEAEIGRPISDVSISDGHINVTIHINDMDQLESAINTFREQFDDITVNRIIKPDTDLVKDPVMVDRGRLTDRQLEVLRTAHDMGYFTHPKDANANEVADELDIAISTFSEHLAAAESKLTRDLFQH